jgi:GH18 family chitinase
MRRTRLVLRRRPALAAAAIVPVLLALAPGGSSAATAAADPVVGPDAMQQALFGGAPVALAADTSLQSLSGVDVHTVTGARVSETATPATTSTSGSTASTSSTSTSTASYNGGQLTRDVFGFAPYWALSDWTEWQLNRLSTVAYFGITLNGSGGIVSDSGLTGWQSSDLSSLVTAAHQHGARVLVTIKAFDDATINSIDSSSSNRQNAVNTAIGLVKQRGLDGVTVDFEGSATSQYPTLQSDFSTFVAQLASQLHSAVVGSELAVATYSGSASTSSGFMNIGALGRSADALFIMAYDMAFGNTPGNASANAPLHGWTYDDAVSVQQYLSAAPASKIILGVPYYGYKWCTYTTQPNAQIDTVPSGCGSAGVDTYSSMFDDFTCSCVANLQYHWDSTAASPWASWFSASYGANRELYYEDVNSLGAKYDLVNNDGIRGAGIWALGYDSGHTELWDLIGRKFGPADGYWMVASDGGIFPFGAALNHSYGSTGGMALNQPIVGMAATASGNGYWLVASDGGIFPFGDARQHSYGSTGNIRLNKPIVGMARTLSGNGYWLVASDGGIFPFGDALQHSYGSTGNIRLNKPIVGMARTLSGNGYWLVASDGGIFPFGDALQHSYGSTGNMVLNQPIVGMARTASGNGYWLVASDGGIFPFGDALQHSYGSTGNIRLNQPIVGMAATPDGNGYWLVAADGGIFPFGDAVNHSYGSLGGQRLAKPVVGMALYWPGY